MLSKTTPLLLSLSLCWVAVGCEALPPADSVSSTLENSASGTRLKDGHYPVQQVTYNDGDGVYTLFLFNTAPGSSAAIRTTDLKLAQLTEAEAKAGQKEYVQIQEGKASLHIPQNFKIQYIHSVADTQDDPQTSEIEPTEEETVTSFWAPFAGAVAGQAVGNALTSPQYYVPPAYRPGKSLRGYGSSGRSYDQAAARYQERYKAPPLAERNRQFRTSGQQPPSSTPKASKVPSSTSSSSTSRSNGFGYGSSSLRSSGSGTSSGSFSSFSGTRGSSSSSFGSSRSSSGGGRR